MRFPSRRSSRGRPIGWLALLGSLLAVTGLAFLPSPYVVEQPGPTFDTLGEVDGTELITFGDVEEYPTDGTLRLLTVTIDGSPEYPLTWLDVAGAYLDPSDEIVPVADVFAPGETVEESNEAGQIEMRNSQVAAVAAALIYEGYDVESTVTVAGVIEDSPAEGILAEGDQILSVNGDTAYDVASIRASIARVDGPTVFVVEREGQQLEVSVTAVEDGGARIVGIYPENDFTFPVSVDIELPNVGGPSAGMMFALGIVDKLTPGALTGGVAWAGTGTISALGDVGPIGGIEQKMYGALEAGAGWFLAPAANCDAVVGNIPAGLNVVAVATLDDAVAAIEAVAAGETADENPEALPSCDAFAEG